MKRKLLLAFAISALLMLVFAISIFAAEIPEWTEITEVDGMPDKSVFGTDGTKGATSRVLMSDGITYPAYYICKNSTSLGFSYSDLSSKSGKTYAAKDVVRLEVPNGVISTPQAVLKAANGYTSLLTVSLPEGFTTLNGYTFYGSTDYPSALITVTFPSTLETMGQKEFLDCIALEELIIPEGVTTIPLDFAKNATSLKKVVLPSTVTTINEAAFRSCDLSDGIVIPEGCTTIGQYAFKGSGLKSIVVPSTITSMGVDAFRECSSLTYVNCKCDTLAKNMFYACPNIETVILENTVTISDYAFCNPSGGTTNISTLVLPEGLTSIGAYAFTRNALTEIVLPSTLTTVGSNVFNGSTQLKRVVVLGSIIGTQMFQNCTNMNELVLTENITTMNNQCIGGTSSSFTTYYTGTDYDRIRTLGEATGADRFSTSKTTYCTYEDYINKNYTAKTCLFVYDCNLCDVAFDGIHTNPGDDGDCTTALICSMCNEYTIREALSHITDERLTYTSFMKEGEYYVGCTNEGCEHGSTEKLEPLFICLGYSTPESGNGGISIGYRVNDEAILAYETITGKTVSYGLFATTKQGLGEGDIIGENGEAGNGTLIADIGNEDFTFIFIKMFGFDTEESKKAEFAIGAFVGTTKEGVTAYSYLQAGKPNEGEKYSFIKYSDFVSQ